MKIMAQKMTAKNQQKRILKNHKYQNYCFYFHNFFQIFLFFIKLKLYFYFEINIYNFEIMRNFKY